MLTSSPPDRLILVVAIVSLALGSLLTLPVVLSASKVRMPALEPASGSLAIVTESPIIQLSAQAGETLRRPLFSRSRRPPLPKPVPAPPPILIPPPDLAVTGIIAISSGGIAIGNDKQAQKPFRVRTGETLGIWKVEAITKNNLRLRYNAQIQDYPLTTPPLIAPAPPPR